MGGYEPALLSQRRDQFGGAGGHGDSRGVSEVTAGLTWLLPRAKP
jgi:hypothetical protein